MKGNKVIISLLIVVIILIAGLAFMFLQNKKEDGNEEPGKTTTTTTEQWNPYAITKRHLISLNDFLISASHGEHIVKMSVTIELSEETDVQKFDGWEKAGVNPSAAGGHGKESEDTLTPMEIVMNTTINDAMLSMNEKSIYSIPTVQKELKTQLNKKLGLGDTFVKEVYVDNFLIQ